MLTHPIGRASTLFFLLVATGCGDSAESPPADAGDDDSGLAAGDGGGGAGGSGGGSSGAGGGGGGSGGAGGMGGAGGSGGDDAGATEDAGDTTPPETTIVSGPAQGSSLTAADFAFEFSCDEPPCTFQCALDRTGDPAVPLAACTSGTVHVVVSGDYRFTVVSADASGNVDTSPAAVDFTFTSTRPVAAFDKPTTLFGTGDADFDFTCSAASCTYFCSLDAAAFAACGGSFIAYAGLAEGSHVIEVYAHDDGTGLDGLAASLAFTIDLTPPDPPIVTSTPSDPSGVGSVSFDFACNESSCTYLCSLDGETEHVCTPPHVRLVVDGDHELSVRAVDAASHVGDATLYAWTTAGLPAPTLGSIAAGKNHTCAIAADRTLWCWGRTNELQTGTSYGTRWTPAPLPVAGADWIAVELGDAHSCGIQEVGATGKGSLWCWGTGSDYRLGVDDNDSRPLPTRVGSADDWAQVSAGGAFTCGIRVIGSERRLYCWGLGSDGQTGTGGTSVVTVPTEVSGSHTDWIAVSAGFAHACGIREDATTSERTVHCWGEQFYGRLGNGLTVGANVTAPVQITFVANVDWTSVAAGADFTCGIGDTELYCWGRNDKLQAGQSSAAGTQFGLPTQVGTDVDWIDVAGGDYHACARRTIGPGLTAAYCWGYNHHQQTGIVDPLQSDVPTQVGSYDDVSSVTVGGFHTCGTRDLGASIGLACWGDDVYGQLGQGRAEIADSPTATAGSAAGWSQVSVATAQGCAIRANETLWCWGSNGNATLGNGADKSSRSVPTQVGADNDWIDVATGRFGVHVCGIRRVAGSRGTAWCWGYNYRNQCGQASMSDVTAPTQIPSGPLLTLDYWVQLSAGGNHTCGIQEIGGPERRLWCWGYNSNLQLGATTAGNASATPVQPDLDGLGATATDWLVVSTGEDHTCALRDAEFDSTGTLWCWGDRLTFGGGDPAPAQVGSDDDWLTVVAANAHDCGLRSPGTLWCWGWNTRGQLGDGTMTDSLTPVQVGTESDWVAIGLGDETSCGVRQDGSLWCWGADAYGLLGDGNGVGDDVLTPQQVTGGAGAWSDVVSAPWNTCALTTDVPPHLECWGARSYGLTAEGIAWMPTPQAVN